jgi:hypothetical protein
MAHMMGKFLADHTIDGMKIKADAIDGQTHIQDSSIPLTKIDWPEYNSPGWHDWATQQSLEKLGNLLGYVRVPDSGGYAFRSCIQDIIESYLRNTNAPDCENFLNLTDRLLKLEEKFKTVDEFSELRNRVKGFSLI